MFIKPIAQRPRETAPYVTTVRLFHIVPGMGLVALDKRSAELYRAALWTVEGATQILSADDRRLYVLNDKEQVLAVERATGEVKFTGDVGAYDFFAMNPVDNTIYAVTKNGRIAAIKASESVGLATSN